MGSENLIIQTYGRNNYDEVEYEINDKKFKTKLTSEALFNYYGGDILFLIPESMITADDTQDYIYLSKLLFNSDEFFKYFYDKIRNQLLNKDIKIDAIKMQSVGEYKFLNSEKTIYFNNSIGNISIYLFKDLLKRIENYNKIILDLSTGLNYYSHVAIETMKYIITYLKIKNFLNDFKKEFLISYSTPIVNKASRILLSRLDAKAFFELPRFPQIKNLDENESKSRKEEIGKYLINNFEKDFEELDKIFNETKIGFNAVKYNTPLAFYTDIFDYIKKYNENEMLEKIFNFLDSIENYSMEKSNYSRIIRFKLNSREIFNSFLLISHSLLIKEILEKRGVALEKRDEALEKRGEASLEEIYKYFENIYKKLNLNINTIFLERDKKEIEKNSSGLDYKEKKLGELFQQKGKDEDEELSRGSIERISSNIKRNFFAHSGFESTMVLVKKVDGKIYLRYEDGKINEIRSWLQNPA